MRRKQRRLCIVIRVYRISAPCQGQCALKQCRQITRVSIASCPTTVLPGCAPKINPASIHTAQFVSQAWQRKPYRPSCSVVALPSYSLLYSIRPWQQALRLGFGPIVQAEAQWARDRKLGAESTVSCLVPGWGRTAQD